MHKYIHLYRMMCVYASTKLDERDYNWYLQQQLFSPLHCNHNRCRFVHGSTFGCNQKNTQNKQKNPKTKQKSADDALQIEAQ